MSYFINF